MIDVKDLKVSYGHIQALQGITLTVPRGELRAVIGPNGAGKTTLMRAIMGLAPAAGGSIHLGGVPVTGMAAHEIARREVALVAEGRAILGKLTVRENLEMGGYVLKDSRRIASNIDQAFARFPRLAERRHQVAGMLSGGEQQMLAIARALISEPKVVLVDEPSLGLAPLIVKEVFRILREIHREGTTILLVEQSVHRALSVADWVYVLETGRITWEGSPAEAALDQHIATTYLGVRGPGEGQEVSP